MWDDVDRCFKTIFNLKTHVVKSTPSQKCAAGTQHLDDESLDPELL